MSGERRQVATLFSDALILPAPERQAFLDRACGDDPQLRSEVESLLAAHRHAEGFLATPALAATPGTVPAVLERVGAYRCCSLLGVGGMGEVYLAERCDDAFDRQVAIKVIRAGALQDAVVRRFTVERSLLARLEHPNVAALFDGGTTDDGRPYIVMEYVNGLSITEHAEAHRLDLPARLNLFLQVCEAVQHAHRHLIVHRDLKPNNILVTPDAVVKLLDFGIAKLLTDDHGHMDITATGTRPLTPRYASPEQVDGQPITTATDIYSLGVVLYELVTGVPPYDLGSSDSTDYRQIIREAVPRKPSTAARTQLKATTSQELDPRRIVRQLEGDLDTVILTALRKEPSRRYDSVASLSDDIRRSMSNRPITARPPSFAYDARMFVRRHRSLVTAGAVMIALLILGIIGTSWQRSRAIAARDRAESHAAIADALNAFLIDDLLTQASPMHSPDRDLTVRTVLDTAAARVGDRFDDTPEVKASILHTLGVAYWHLGEYDAAAPLVDQAIELREAAYGAAHYDTIESRRTRAALSLETGEPNTAGREFQAILAALNAEGRGDSAQAHSIRSDYGLALFEQGEHDRAKQEYTAAVDALNRLVGPEDPATMSAMSNLAQLYSFRSTPERAIPLYLDLLATQRRLYGDDHPETQVMLNNIGMAYINMRQWADAEPYFVAAVDIASRVIGDDHSDTLTARNNLALAYYGQGNSEQAIIIFEDLLRIRAATLDADHPDLLQSRNNLAFLYNEVGRFDEGIELEQSVLEDRRRILGDLHPNTLNTMNNVGLHLQSSDRNDEALVYLRECLDGRHQALEPGDISIYITWNNLGRSLFALEQFDEAVTLYRAAVADAREHYRKVDRTLAVLLQGLGKSLLEQGKSPAEAERWLREARDILTASDPEAPEIPVLDEMILEASEMQ